jgi:hypothetical protein
MGRSWKYLLQDKDIYPMWYMWFYIVYVVGIVFTHYFCFRIYSTFLKKTAWKSSQMTYLYYVYILELW